MKVDAGMKRIIRSLSAAALALCWVLVTQGVGALAAAGTVYEIIDAAGAEYDECALGDLTADALRWATGADIALVGGGLLRTNLPYGELTGAVLEAAYTDNAAVRVYELGGETLYSLFELSVGRECQQETGELDPAASAFAGFLQVSGVRLVWDASAPAGSRVYRLEDAAGNILSAEKGEYCARVAVTSDLLLPEYGYAALLGEAEAGETDLFACLTAYAEAEGELYTPEADRIYVRAAGRDRLVREPRFVLLAIAVLFLGSAFTKRAKLGHSDN